MLRNTKAVLLEATVLGLLGLLGACSAGAPGENEAPTMETDACHSCRAVLVDCASASESDEDFVACRDAWQACQAGKGIRAGDCSNPSDDEACSLCRERRGECTADGGGACDEEFGVCKSLLMTRGDLAETCGAEETPPAEVLCDVCQKDFAACVSDASGQNRAACGPKFALCLASHHLEGQHLEAQHLEGRACAPPRGDEGCSLCLEHHDACAASGLATCDADFEACADAIAPACELEGGGGGAGGAGGSGGTGGGGMGGGGGIGCAHDECVEGAALDPACSSCAADVCDDDPYCCDTEWDGFCLDAASALCEC